MDANQDQRPDPAALLAELQKEERQAARGKLYVFLGMCPGVGKTYAMLQAAQQQKREGVDVLVGVVETHGRAETAALIADLDVLPRKTHDYRGHKLEEFDLDAALARSPELILVDELAHTNVPGARHLKRYQDVLELLDAGIDVYSTLNVQHIESQVDIVRQITGVTVQETVPDSILDRADEIQIIDLSVENLLERLREGKVYLGERVNAAASNFFKEGNLTALREMALRFVADRVDRDLEDIRRARRVSSPWKTNARFLVGVGPSPHAESLIRWTRRAATRIGCPWIAAWVEPASELPAAAQESLTRALGLARKLGGEVVSVTGDDVASALLELAHERNVTQIVVGKPDRISFWRRSPADRLMVESGDIDVCIVRPSAFGQQQPKVAAVHAEAPASLWGEYSWALVAAFVLTTVCWGLLPWIGYTVVALVFLLAVVAVAMRLSRGPVLAFAAASALSWDYFFIPPQFTFYISKLEDVILFVLFFVVALSMGHLTSRLRQREQSERRRQQQTAALLRVTQSAALSAERDKGLAEALRVVDAALHGETALVVREPDRKLARASHPASSFTPAAKEWGVISWVFENKRLAGRFTDTLPRSDATWFPLQTATAVMGVLGVLLPEEASMHFSVRQTIEALALQIALVLEKQHFIEAVQRAEMLEHSEKLRRTLLDSVSHELKTPLAVIRASLEGLADIDNPYLTELRTAAGRLQRVVDNFLNMTRLDSSIVQPSRDWCDVRDVVASAQEAAGEALKFHPLAVTIADDMPLIEVDPNLLSQSVANILHNAAIYTPSGTPIEIKAELTAGTLRLAIHDHGSGLPPGSETRLFEKFYRGEAVPAGGTGLGLAIARGFIRLQGGEITARNHPHGGAEFLIALPVNTENTTTI